MVLLLHALARVTNDGMEKLRSDLFAKLVRADLSLFSRQSASALSNTVVYEVQIGASQLVSALIGLTRDGFTLLALVGYLMWLNWQLTLVVFTVAPGLSWIMKVLSRRLYGLTKESQKATDDLAYVVEENVLAHRMVRLHGAQGQQMGRFNALGQRLRRLALKSTAASAAMTPLTQIMAAVALSLVLMIALAKPRSGVVRDGGGLCGLHHSHVDADRAHQTFGRCGQPHHPRLGRAGAWLGPDARRARRKPRPTPDAAGKRRP